jgi:hypothetical protein
LFPNPNLEDPSLRNLCIPIRPRQPPHRIWIELPATMDFMLATLVGKGARESVATLPAIKAPANPPINAILRVRIFSSVNC